jgi:hypothetical protein
MTLTQAAVSEVTGRDIAFHANSIVARIDVEQFGVSTASCGFCVPARFLGFSIIRSTICNARVLHARAAPLRESTRVFRIALIVGGRVVAHC